MVAISATAVKKSLDMESGSLDQRLICQSEAFIKAWFSAGVIDLFE